MCRRLSCIILVAVVVGLGGRPVDADLPDGLVGYYKMDETGGEAAADVSGNGYDGLLMGEFEWVSGYDGGALAYPGGEDAPDRVEIPAGGLSATAGTVAMWGYLDDPQPASEGRYFFGHTTQPQWENRIQVYMQIPNASSDSRLLDIGLGDNHQLDTDIVELPLEEWLHVALTWDHGGYTVYVDGERVSDGTYTGLTDIQEVANIGNDGSLGPGANSEPYEGFAGKLDEVRIYDRALSATEVAEIVELPAEPRITAWGAMPPDGAVDVLLPFLQWKSLGTIMLHDVYFGTDPNLGPDDLVAPRTALELYYHMPGVTPGQRYYWRVDEIEADMTVHTGVVWTFLAMPYTAYLPAPPDGANTVSPDPNMQVTWLAGMGAQQHHLYFGDSLPDVNDRAAQTDKGTLTEPNFAPGPLSPLTTYYWRVDESDAAGGIRDGAVWSFTTFKAVDDFESYTNQVGQRVFEVWIDGIGYSQPDPGHPGNGSNAAVGYDIWTPGSPYTTVMETEIVYGGAQSLPADYNNVIAPYYSEIERTWATPQNWTVNGADTLTLHVCGMAANGADRLYVVLQDNLGRSAVVAHEDASVLTFARWQAWPIPYVAFEGVNPAAVTKLIIGMGDRDAPTPGGAGLVFLDDIYLTRPAPGQEPDGAVGQ